MIDCLLIETTWPCAFAPPFPPPVSDIRKLAQTSHLSDQLLDALLPGPVTLLLRQRDDAALSPLLCPSTACIGVRIPDYSFLRHAAAKLGE